MCRCTAQPNALCPRVEIVFVAVVVVLAWLEKNNNIIIIIRKKMNILAYM